MSAQVFNRIAALEQRLEALAKRLAELEKQQNRACDEVQATKPTLTLRQKAERSHA